MPLLTNGLDTINDRVSELELAETKGFKELTLKKTATLISLSESVETGGFAKEVNQSPPSANKDGKISSLGSENTFQNAV